MEFEIRFKVKPTQEDIEKLLNGAAVFNSEKGKIEPSEGRGRDHWYCLHKMPDISLLERYLRKAHGVRSRVVFDTRTGELADSILFDQGVDA